MSGGGGWLSVDETMFVMGEMKFDIRTAMLAF